MFTICLQTSCYQKSYKHVLNTMLPCFNSKFSKTIFKEKQLIINNMIDSINLSELIKDFNILYSSNNTENILNSFGIKLNEYTKDNINYSIQHYVGIFNTTCDYIFHISEDCNIDNLDDTFIMDCITKLEENPNYICALPNWMKDTKLGGKQEAINTDGNFYVCYGFTDQVYVIKIKKFKDKIYNYLHPDSVRYPLYGGPAFEKRINSWMYCNNLYRIVHKDYYFLPGFYDKEIKGI
jgi:hypothetical protein